MKIYIKNNVLSLVWCILAAITPAGIQAEEYYELSLGVQLEHFDYTELDTDNTVLNKEYGNLPGFSLGIERRQENNWLQGVRSTLQTGDVTYDGQTQSGIPVMSTSDTLILETEAYIGYRLSRQKHTSLLYAGLGHHYWRREIRPTVIPATGQPVSGLLEHYNWSYALFAYKWTYAISREFELGIDIQARRILRGTMEVVSNSFDNATVDLGERWGTRIAVPLHYNFNKKEYLVVEPYINHWDIGRSNVVPQTVNGVPTGFGLVEPRSQTRDHGIALYYRQPF